MKIVLNPVTYTASLEYTDRNWDEEQLSLPRDVAVSLANYAFKNGGKLDVVLGVVPVYVVKFADGMYYNRAAGERKVPRLRQATTFRTKRSASDSAFCMAEAWTIVRFDREKDSDKETP